MRIAFTIPAVLAALAYAASNGSDVSTSVASTQTCITKYRPAHNQPSSLPTRTKCSSQTVSSVITTCGTELTVTTTITPDPVTATANGSFIYEPTLVTKPAKRADCSTTTTLRVGKTTVYTGTYNGTAAKRTASPLDRRYPIAKQRRSAFKANLFHYVGQKAVNAGRKAVAIDCFDEVTTYVLSTSTIQEEPTTVIVTASTPTVYVTPAIKAVSAPTSTVSITTTITAGAGNATSAGTCTVTAASSTTTQHIKCAPTNLVGEVNGYGIGQTGSHSGSTYGLAPGSDASACCQLCVNDDECAASEDDTDAKNCFLWYTTPSSCGIGFQYSDGGQSLEPGSGFLVQTGCGTVEATDDF
ncbi:hypothetical protein M409DRAFT_18050 [Zasmidium cellare ATCC 36951]|uniref:Apple domain-containing protein n=1 Tax=Zasmidium cellare ATCC 36951 TaxID=1080233 RepID=A0A6A6CX64_ZASCE|nr:uncharacterized protein M409DRAFT_18050 [Zasmidium cellare ATCC 36951]KAF2171817.1 hypothetical protein M409DRAFT_18050 [Zasmidium cellare ATCC 36951]